MKARSVVGGGSTRESDIAAHHVVPSRGKFICIVALRASTKERPFVQRVRGCLLAVNKRLAGSNGAYKNHVSYSSKQHVVFQQLSHSSRSPFQELCVASNLFSVNTACSSADELAYGLKKLTLLHSEVKRICMMYTTQIVGDIVGFLIIHTLLSQAFR